eukprot:4912621-Pyramimonas_sp.AAC.1
MPQRPVVAPGCSPSCFTRWSGSRARAHTGNGAASHLPRSGAPWPAPDWRRPLLMIRRFQWVSRYTAYLTVPGPR